MDATNVTSSLRLAAIATIFLIIIFNIYHEILTSNVSEEAVIFFLEFFFYSDCLHAISKYLNLAGVKQNNGPRRIMA